MPNLNKIPPDSQVGMLMMSGMVWEVERGGFFREPVRTQPSDLNTTRPTSHSAHRSSRQ
jgi:hypothetical protein